MLTFYLVIENREGFYLEGVGKEILVRSVVLVINLKLSQNLVLRKIIKKCITIII